MAKLPLLAIDKFQNPHVFKNVKTLLVVYNFNNKAWMLSSIFGKWLSKIKQKIVSENHFMIADNGATHPKLTSLSNINLVFLPPNTTSKTQPIDQGVIQPLKMNYRRLLIHI